LTEGGRTATENGDDTLDERIGLSTTKPSEQFPGKGQETGEKKGEFTKGRGESSKRFEKGKVCAVGEYGVQIGVNAGGRVPLSFWEGGAIAVSARKRVQSRHRE